jgi:hypothetical protein
MSATRRRLQNNCTADTIARSAPRLAPTFLIRWSYC